MNKKIIVIISLLSLLLISCSGSNTSNLSNAEDFSLTSINGDQVSLEDYEGEKLAIRFWASWCSICLSELDEVNRTSLEAEGYKLITIVSPGHNGEQETDDFIAWFKSLDYDDMEGLLDTSGQVYTDYGVRGYPTTVLINSKGQIDQVRPGPMSQETLEALLEEIE
jgi:peroxiredoxin